MDFSDTLYSNWELKKYHKQLPRLELVKGILYRKLFDNTGKNFVRQYLVRKHLREKLFYRVHNSEFGGHLGMKATAHEFRFYYCMFSESLVSHVKNCSSCFQVKPVQKTMETAPLQHIASEQSLPGDLLQIDLGGELQPSNGFIYILTEVDVFTRYLFAEPLRTDEAESVARAFFAIFMRHSYLPSTIPCDLGSAFTSSMKKQRCALLEVQIKYAGVKHPQTIGVVERSLAPLNRILNIYENNQTRD